MSNREREEMAAEQKKVSMFTCVERWLESFPELDEKNFNFPAKFEQAILAMIKKEKDKAKTEEDKQRVEKVYIITCVCFCNMYLHT